MSRRPARPSASPIFSMSWVSQDPDTVKEVSCNTRFFDTETGTGGGRLIKTKRSFDTLETLTVVFEDDSTLPVIFKDSLYVTNLAPLCTEMSILINGKTYSNNSQETYDEKVPVSGKKLYDLSIDFAELPDKQFSDYEQLQFQLPVGFTLPDNFNEMNHMFVIDMALGGRLKNNKITYDKSSNKVIVDWNRDDTTAFNNFRGSSTAKFTLMLSGNLDPSFGKLIFSTDKIIELEQENLHNASVIKTASYAPYQISYEIRVISDGTNENLTLTDQMGIALQNPEQITFSFADDAHVDDPAYSPSLVSNENGTFTVSIPKMDDEDILTIRYISDVNVEKIARSANATFEETGNTARIVGDNDPSDNEDSAWVSSIEFSDIEKNVIEYKNVRRNGDTFTDITWQVITNRDAMITLAGSQLTDVMSETAMEYSRYSGDGVTVKCYDKNGDLAAVRSIPWEDLGIDTENASSFTYNIPETDPPYKYVMEYKTSSGIMDLTEQTYVSNTVTGKCGIAEAGQLLNPPDGGNIAVSKSATNIHSDRVTWEIKVDIREDALDGNIKLSEAQANDKGEITLPNYLPRSYIPPATAADGTVLIDRDCQEALESLEIIGLEQGEKVRVYYYYSDKKQTYYDSDPSMWHDGVLTMSGFQSSTSERWPSNKFYMFFYKDYDMNPGLNHPEDGSERRLITVRMNNSFPVAWADYARDYINASETYRPGIFTHTNWVVVNGVKATAAFNTQPTSVYKHVLNNGVNYTANNPVATVRMGDPENGPEKTVIYPVYRFSVSVNGIYSDDPIVIDDTFDTSIFKLFDKADFGGNRCFVEKKDDSGNYEYRYINWIMPQFGGKSEIGWSGAGGSDGFTYRTDNQNADPALNHTTDEVIDGRRVISNDDVKVEETEKGLRFTFRNMEKFKKANGQYYNFYIVDYYLVPRSVEALAEIERRVAADESGRTAPITNTASFRDNTTTAMTFLSHKNDFGPVSKTFAKMGTDVGEDGEQHPKIKFQININPGQISLNEGREMEVTDTYSSSLAVDYRSVKVTSYPESNISFDYSGNVGRFVIPDNTYVIIDYEATIISKPEQGEDNVPFSNTVDVNGYSAKVADEASVSVQSNGEAITPEIFIFKYRTNHMETGLNGAVFELLDENKQPIVVNEQPFRMTSEHDASNGKDGQIHLKLSQVDHGFTLSADKFYYIHEVTPPTGYYGSDVYYQFKIRTDGKVDYSSREYLNGDTLNVRNSPMYINVNLNKKIEGNVKISNAELALLHFSLEKYDEETKSWKAFGENGEYGDVSYSSFTGGSTVFKNLGIGKYRITESGNDSILENHTGADAYVKYEWDDNISGTSPSAEFQITRDFLDSAQDKAITFTNTFSTETVDRKATKKWYDVDGTEINWPKGMKVTLDVVTFDNGVPGTVPVKSVELDGVVDDEGEFISGTASFNGLPKFQADGQTVQQYAVKEATTFEGYESDDDYYLMPNSQAVTIKNTKLSTSLTVKKLWVGGAPQNATATVCLWGYPQGGKRSEAKALSTLTVTPTQNCESVTSVTGGEQWEIRFDDVPVTNDADIPLEYFFTEVGCSPGYEASYPNDETSDGTFSVADGVISNAIAKTSFTVTKQWRNTQNNQWPNHEEIRLTVRRAISGGTPDAFRLQLRLTDESCVPSGTLADGSAVSFENKGNGRYCLVIEGLNKYNSDGKLWNYYVTEDELEGFSAVYQDETHADVTATRGNAPNGGYILNTGAVYTLTVSKRVTGNFGDRRNDFLFTVHMQDAAGAPYTGTLEYEKTSPTEGAMGSLQFDEEGNATVSLRHAESLIISKIPAGMFYSVTEERSGARGYTVQSSANGTPRAASPSQYVIYGPLSDDTGKLLSNQNISYVNERSRIIPTGVELQLGSSVALFLLFTVGLAWVMIRRRPDGDEE